MANFNEQQVCIARCLFIDENIVIESANDTELYKNNKYMFYNPTPINTTHLHTGKLQRKEYALRITIGLIFVAWLVLIFVASFYLYQSTRDQIKEELINQTQNHKHHLSTAWHSTTSQIQAVVSKLNATSPTNKNRLTSLAQNTQNTNPAITSIIVTNGKLPGFEHPATEHTQEITQWWHTQKSSIMPLAAEGTLLKLPNHANSLIYAVPLMTLGQRTALFVLDFAKITSQVNVGNNTSVVLKITKSDDTLYTTTLGKQPPEIGFQHHSRINFGEQNWQLNWAFTKNPAALHNHQPAIIMGLTGLLSWLLGLWLINRQRWFAKRIRQEVIERTHKLEEAGRRFKLLTDNAYDLISIISKTGQINYTNTAFHRILNYTKDELKDVPFTEIVHPQDRDQFSQSILDAWQGGQTQEIDLRLKHKSGHYREVNAVPQILPDYETHEKTVVVHCRDITRQKRVTHELKLSEQRFKDFADASADWLWETDDLFRFTFISSSITRVLGLTPDKLIGKNPMDVMFSRRDDQQRQILQERIRQQEPFRDLEFWTRGRGGESICLRTSGMPVFDENGIISGFRGIASNITSTKKTRDELYQMASTDHLTRLLNRRRFMEELERTIHLARQHKAEGVLMWIDLDRFKEINDTHGHAAGDMLLKGITEILKNNFRNTDILARLGGDEFAVIMHKITPDQAMEKVNSLIERVKAFSIEYNGTQLNVTMSVGMVTYPQEDKDATALMMSADLAMYRAKDMGRNRIYFEETTTEGDAVIGSVREQLKWVNRLRTCLETGDFEMHFQPIVAHHQKERTLFEALLRIHDTDGNIASPALYIDAAEHFGLIQQLDLAVTERIFQTQMANHEKGIEADISINLSSRSLGDANVMQSIRDLLHTYPINPQHIIFEVTETVALHDPTAWRDIDEIKEFIVELRSIGFRFAIDDFGSGFSSFSYLRKLPLDMVKIDGTFVKHLNENTEDQLFVKSIAQLCQGLNIETVAEFVENEEIVALLCEMGIDYGQGWHFARPAADLEGLVNEFADKTLQTYNTQAKPAQPKKRKTPASTSKKSNKSKSQ